MTTRLTRLLCAALCVALLLPAVLSALADDPVHISAVYISPNSLTLAIGGSESLSVSVEPWNTTENQVSFSSTDPSIASVSGTGVVTGRSAGSTIIYATSLANSYLMATCVVTVLENTEVTLSDSSLFMKAGGVTTLNANVTPYQIASQGVRFSSSNTSVAVVSNSGSNSTVVTAMGDGTATIYATAADGTMATCAVTVGTRVSDVSVSPTLISINTGSQTSVTAKVSPATATDTSVKWSSSNTNVATVDAYGNVTTWCAGTAYITASANDGSGLSASCQVMVLGVDVTHPPTPVPTGTPTPTLAPGSTPTPPPNGAKATNIASGSLNLRASQSQNAKILTTIPKGGTFYVLDQGTKWTHVWYKGKVGYVMNQYVSSYNSFTPPPPWVTPTPTPSPEPGAPAGDLAFVNTPSGSLNLRATASASGRILARIPKGNTFTLIKYGSTWSEVYYRGNRGYVMSKYVGMNKTTPTPTPAPAELVTPTPEPIEGSKARVSVKNNGQLNLRSAASQTSNRVRLIPNGEIIDILQYGKEWCHASYKGSTGYVMTKYLVLGTGVDKSGAAAKPTATVPVSDATHQYAKVNTIVGGLNLRKGPGVGYARILIIPRNAYVTVVTSGTTWSEVNYNGNVGYVQTVFLKKI